jgi:hypothetical protein
MSFTPSGDTSVTSSENLAQVNGATVAVGNGAPGAGTQQVAVATNTVGTAPFVKVTDGTDTALVTAAGELNVLATAQPGVDIGDTTINNAGGAAAVNIQDGGNSITVDNGGTFAVQATLPSGSQTTTGSTATGNGSTTAGIYSVLMVPSSTFVGTIAGVTWPSATQTFTLTAREGKTLGAIVYTISAGSLNIFELSN